MHVHVKTESAEETLVLAEHIGRRLRGGEFIELVSDVGGGKTTFVRGLAKGAGSEDHVSSPTFTISKVYAASDFRIVHFDFYRLQQAGLIEHEIQEAIADPRVVVVVEWSEVVRRVLPQDRLVISIDKAGEEERSFVIEYPEGYRYLTEQLT